MIERLLVPLDGSPQAEDALAGAAHLAKRCDADIVLVRVTPPGASEFFAGPEHHTSTLEEHTYLDQMASKLSQDGVRVHAKLSLASPAEGIARQAELEHVDLILMTTHERTGLEVLLHSSVTWQVLTQTPAPILAWKRDEAAADQSPLPRFMRDAAAPLLVPLDGSLPAERALPFAEELAHLFGNPLVLVRAAELVYYPGMEGNPQMVDEVSTWRLAEAHSYLQHKRLELVHAGFQVEIDSAQGSVAPLIEAWVQQYQVGLVVMASHGRGWLGRLVLGSVAKQVLSHVNVPMLLVRRPLV